MIISSLNKFLTQQLNFLQKKWNFSFTINDLNLNITPQDKFGDYSTPIAFKIARQINKSPLETAQLIKYTCELHLPSFIEKIEIKEPGYLNFFIKPQSILKEFKTLLKSNFKNKIKNTESQKPIIIEYSSPNIAKPMHIGHLRSTIIGESLARIYEYVGYRVLRWNYLGDWGTQFGKLIIAYKLWGNKQEIKKNPIKTLLNLYQKFHQELKKHPELEQLARNEFQKLVAGDKINIKLWQWFKKVSLDDFQKIYKLLDIKFNIVKGEAEFEKNIKSVIKILQEKQLIKESQGALVIPLDQFNLPVALIQKNDGTSLYLTRDLATLIYRLEKYSPIKILYVVGGEQELYFKQLFTLIHLLLPKLRTELIHVKFGLVLNTDKKKFSTREGELVLLEDVIKEAKNKASQIIKNKHPNWPYQKQEKVALTLALATLKFNDLKNYRTTNLVFNWDKMYDYHGASAIYLLYTYARFNKILKKVSLKTNLKFNYLKSSLEIKLIKKAINFPTILDKTIQELAPNILASYLLELTDLLNNYYETIPILKENNKNIKEVRLNFIKHINNLLKTGLFLLGIETLEEI